MEPIAKENKKRPTLVWVISILTFFSALFTLISYSIVFSGNLQLDPAQKAYFESLTFVDWGLSIGLMLINLTAAVMLMCLRKLAYYLFIAGFAVNISTTVLQIFTKGFLSASTLSSLMGMFVSWGVLLAICLYIKKLVKSGVLS